MRGHRARDRLEKQGEGPLGIKYTDLWPGVTGASIFKEKQEIKIFI